MTHPHLIPYDSVLDTIGWTPLIRLGRVGAGIRTPIFGKAEYANPGGSVKDRIGLAIIEAAEQRGDDLKPKMGALFPRTVRLKPGETVVFSWIVYKSRTHRDSVNKKVMKDPRMLKMMETGSMPFDLKRMAYGGFKVLVDV